MSLSPGSKRSTDKFKRQGHTASGHFGDNPTVVSPSGVGDEPRVLKP